MAPALSLLSRFLLFTALPLAAHAKKPDNNTYDYIVVGTGPGGGPLAVNLAKAGNSVLVLEAGDDQTANVNISEAANFLLAGNDPSTRWDFFVKHSDDPVRENNYHRTTWRKPNGQFYVGLDPPTGSTRLGIYYPRSGTLGGCAMHNACLTMNPNNYDWDLFANITGDKSWEAKNMRKYLIGLEHVNYLPVGTAGHGFDGFLEMTMIDAPLDADSDQTNVLKLLANATGYSEKDLPTLVKRDMNGNQPDRDNLIGIFGGVSHFNPQGKRSSPGYYIKQVLTEGKYPLTLSLDSLATKVLFDKNAKKPKAIGIEYLKGKHMYSGDPAYNPKDPGTLMRAYASKEVIISGGVFNSPQILKLSGIGPADELKKFNIPVVKDLPGVGQRMQDNYEASFLALAAKDVKGAPPYFPFFQKTKYSNTGIRDVYGWCGSFSFEGFWPGFPEEYGPREYECAFAHMNPHPQNGTVTLTSSDPRAMPAINLHFFSTPESQQDLHALVEAANVTRNALAQVPGLAPFSEKHPCEGASVGGSSSKVCSTEEQATFIRDQAYSHHATSSCAIGADDDPLAVLDSKFRVRGVKGLRVVDASAFPRVPGAFPVLPSMMISMKASEDILMGR